MRPFTSRKKIQLMVCMTILAWATQTLLHQWGFGQEIRQTGAMDPLVPGTPRFAAGVTLELRAEATIDGPDAKLGQLCRWSKADADVLAPLADVVLARLEANAGFKTVTLEEIRQALHDAGVNLAVVKFSGPTRCNVGRSDLQRYEGAAVQQWADADRAGATAAAPETQPAQVAAAAAVASADDGRAAPEQKSAVRDIKAARDVKPAAVAPTAAISTVPLARAGQFITVTLTQGTSRVKTVVRALEGGSLGQSIHVKNEATGDVYEAALTGPHEASMGELPRPAATPAMASVKD